MQLRWHKVQLNCKKCDAELGITAVFSSADGEIRLNLICVKCGVELAWVSNTARLIATALYADIEECMAQKEPSQIANLPIRPPLAEPHVKEDTDFLHDIGIGGGLE